MPIPLALAAKEAKIVPALAGAGVKYFQGRKQVKQGEKMDRENVFQNYYRPQESLESLQLSKNAYNNQGVPGQQIIENNINSSAATGLDNISRNTSSSGDLLDSAIKLEANKTQQIANLGVAGAQQQERDVASLQGQLGVQSGYADKEFNYNVAQPFERKAAAASALIEAGNVNKFGGINDALGAATSALDTAPEEQRTGAMSAPTPIQAPTSVMPSQGFDPSSYNGNNMMFDPKTLRMIPRPKI
jgi:hypothetical protein